jgi:glycosyltransferase involved in cell wall biosynthesis
MGCREPQPGSPRGRSGISIHGKREGLRRSPGAAVKRSAKPSSTPSSNSGDAAALHRFLDSMLSGLRILLVTPRYVPLTGGVETHVREIANRLSHRGFDVTVLTTDVTGRLPPIDRSERVKVIRVPGYPRNRDYYWSPAVHRIAADPRWDIVHCQGIHTFVPPLAMLGAIRSATPFFVTFHTGGHSSRLRVRLRGLQWLALAPLLRRAERLIAVSNFERGLFAALPGLSKRRIVVIPNGGDLPVGEGEAVDVDPHLIISLGRLERYKGHQRAIAALPLLHQRIPNVHLRIVGSGPYRHELVAQARTLGVAQSVRISAINSTDREGMARLLASAAVVVLLSDYEAHAIAAIEAIALGRPVVLTDATGLHDLVEAKLAHGVSPKAGPREIADAIHTEMTSPSPRDTHIPTWDDAVDHLADLYAHAARARLPAIDARRAGSRSRPRSL